MTEHGMSAGDDSGAKIYYRLATDASIVPDQPGKMAGEAAIGVILKAPLDEISDAPLDAFSEPIGRVQDHHVAEYRALIRGLEVARSRGIDHLRVCLDSALVVNQLNGAWKVKAAHLKPLHEEASSLKRQFADIEIVWVSRKANAEADALSRAPLGLLGRKPEPGRVSLQRMDNVGIVVDDVPATIAFFRELGLELEGQATIDGEWAGRVTGLRDMRVEVAMMRTPDGHGRLEISRFLTPPAVADHRNAPVNALGYLRIMFAVEDIDDTLARLRKHGAQLVGEVVQYEDVYRLCYIRGPKGLLIGLAEQIG